MPPWDAQIINYTSPVKHNTVNNIKDYIKKWKQDFEEEQILHNVNKDLRKVEEKYAKIDSGQ